MKNKLLLLATGFALTTQMITAQVPQYVPANGLAGWWSFSGNANDASLNVNNGIVTEATLTADRFGNINSAYNFDGNSYITIPNSNSLQNLTDITISSWFNIDSWYESGGGGFFPILHKSDKQYQYGKYALLLRIEGLISHLDSQETGIAYSFEVNKWYHIVSVISNNKTTIYVNGMLVSSTNSGGFPQTAIQGMPLIIGKDMPGLVEYSKGKIDDIGVWNRALTQDEVISLYYAENSCQSLVINTGVLGFNPVIYNNTVTIYPNPANDHITIDCGNLANVNGWSIKIVNTLGQEVFSGAMNTQQYVVPLNTWGGQGIYFVKIYDASNNLMNTKKIILQ